MTTEWLDLSSEKTQAVLLASVVSVTLTILTLFFKDYLLPRLSSNRENRQKKIDLLKKYSIPLIQSSESLCWRLREIFDGRGSYLLKKSHVINYDSYKYISTLYRICALIGWIRASNLEASLVEIENKKVYNSVKLKINNFEIALSDGDHVEVSVLENLATIWLYDLSQMKDCSKRKTAIAIFERINDFRINEKKQLANKLSKESQEKLLISVNKIISESANSSPLDSSIINETKHIAIKEISRVESWIYRDWQNAIGDIMIYEIQESSRRFDIIGYAEFESNFKNNHHSDYIWYERINSLFEGLNVNIEDRFDARVKQLKNVFIACVDILEELNKIKTGQTILTEESLKKLVNSKELMRKTPSKISARDID